MPIYRDPDEPELDGVRPCARLEEWTGADYLVTTSRVPVNTQTLVLSHVTKFGAVLIQVKRGADLFASLGTRILSSLARMREVGAKKHQCLLVTTGLYAPDCEGNATLNHLRYSQCKPYTVSQASPVSVTMKGVYTELRRWGLRGGSYVPLASDSDFPMFLADLEKDLATLPRRREVIPAQQPMYTTDPDDPLQELVLVRDKGLLMLAELIGPTKARAALEAWGDAATALMWLSSPETYAMHKDLYPGGIGPKTVESVRKALGAPVERSAMFEEENESH